MKTEREDTRFDAAAVHRRRGGAVPRRAAVDIRHLGEGVRPAAAGRPPVVGEANRDERRRRPGYPVIPFIGVAEGMVLAAFRRAGVSLQHIRSAVAILESEIGIEHALASQKALHRRRRDPLRLRRREERRGTRGPHRGRLATARLRPGRTRVPEADRVRHRRLGGEARLAGHRAADRRPRSRARLRPADLHPRRAFASRTSSTVGGRASRSRTSPRTSASPRRTSRTSCVLPPRRRLSSSSTEAWDAAASRTSCATPGGRCERTTRSTAPGTSGCRTSSGSSSAGASGMPVLTADRRHPLPPGPRSPRSGSHRVKAFVLVERQPPRRRPG